jgi:hypothetical protein
MPREQGLDLWLAYQHHTLVIDVVGTLEVEAGLRELLIPTHHADLVADLTRCLDIKTGLASITPVAADVTPSTPLPLPNWQPTDPVHVNGAHAQPDAILLEFLHAAASWNPSTRLAMRTHPLFTIASVHDRVHALVLSLGCASDLANGLEGKLDGVLRCILDRVPGLSPDLAWALDRDLDHGLDHTRDLGSYLDRTLDHIRDLTRDLTRDLGNELAHLRGLDHLAPLDLNNALAHLLTLDHALGHNCAQASNYARISTHNITHYLARIRSLIDDLDRTQSFASELTQTIQILIHFHGVLSNVTGVDLRNVNFTGIPLQGLRWSVRTQWPPEIENHIRHDSVQIADGIFEVGHGDIAHILANVDR